LAETDPLIGWLGLIERMTDRKRPLTPLVEMEMSVVETLP